ncbi:MAG: phosphate ABC transporter permease subunit PstC [Promethearchaeota archaeon]
MSVKNKETGVRTVLVLAGFSATLFIFFIVIFLIINGAPFFNEVDASEFFFGTEWHPTWPEPIQSWGVGPIIIGTLLVSLGAMVIAIPVGIGCAICISQLAPSKVKHYLKTGIELLAGVPSIVYGFFGLLILTQWLRISFNLLSGSCWLAGSIILAIMALPTIVTVAEDAISAVPKSYADASLAVGASKWQTIRRVTVPAAKSGIVTAIILGIGRAIGETMAVMMVTGNQAILPQPITDIFSPIRPITATLALELGEVAWGSTHYHALYALAIVLFVIVLIINSFAIFIVKRRGKQYTPKIVGISERKQLIVQIKKTIKPVFYILSIVGLFWVLWISFGPPTNTISSLLITLLFFGLAISIYFLCMKIHFKHIYTIGFVIVLWLFWSWFGLAYTLLCLGIILGIYFVYKYFLNQRIIQGIAFSLIGACMVLVLLSLGLVLFFITVNGVGTLSLEFLTQYPSDLGRAGGIFPAIIGTLLLAGGALLFAGVIGVLAGIYLAEYSSEGKITKIIRAGMDNLNGTPSIVFGMFGFAFFVLYLNFGVCLLAGQLTLGMMILPTITRTTEEAVRAVPDGFREGSLALGATKWQTTYKVVLPNAAPGVITGLVLGFGRAAGETAPILFVAAIFSQRFITLMPFDPVMSLPTHLYFLATGVPNSETNAYGTALVLLILIIIFYGFAMFIRSRYQRFKTW